MDVRFVEILGAGDEPGKVAVSVDNGRFTFEILRAGLFDSVIVMGSGKDDGKTAAETMAEMFGPGPYGADVFGRMLPWLTPITVAHMIDNLHADY